MSSRRPSSRSFHLCISTRTRTSRSNGLRPERQRRWSRMPDRLLPSPYGVLEPGNYLVDRLPVRPAAPLVRASRFWVARAGRIAERQDDHEALALAEAEQAAGGLRIRHAVRGGTDAVVPGHEHHVLGRPPSVERGRPLPANRESHDELRAPDVVLLVHLLSDLLAQLGAFHDQESPRLLVAGA